MAATVHIAMHPIWAARVPGKSHNPGAEPAVAAVTLAFYWVICIYGRCAQVSGRQESLLQHLPKSRWPHFKAPAGIALPLVNDAGLLCPPAITLPPFLFFFFCTVCCVNKADEYHWLFLINYRLVPAQISCRGSKNMLPFLAIMFNHSTCLCKSNCLSTAVGKSNSQGKEQCGHAQSDDLSGEKCT